MSLPVYVLHSLLFWVLFVSESSFICISCISLNSRAVSLASVIYLHHFRALLFFVWYLFRVLKSLLQVLFFLCQFFLCSGSVIFRRHHHINWCLSLVFLSRHWYTVLVYFVTRNGHFFKKKILGPKGESCGLPGADRLGGASPLHMQEFRSELHLQGVSKPLLLRNHQLPLQDSLMTWEEVTGSFFPSLFKPFIFQTLACHLNCIANLLG